MKQSGGASRIRLAPPKTPKGTGKDNHIMNETEKECQAALATLKLQRGERNDLHLTTVNRALVYCKMPPILDDAECEAAALRVMLHILNKNNNNYPVGLDGLNFWRAATVYQNRKMYREETY